MKESLSAAIAIKKKAVVLSYTLRLHVTMVTISLESFSTIISQTKCHFHEGATVLKHVESLYFSNFLRNCFVGFWWSGTPLLSAHLFDTLTVACTARF